jgi:acetyl esterase/lipase
MLRWFIRIILGLVAVVAALWLTVSYITPQPAIWAIRALFDSGSDAASAKLLPKVPSNVETLAAIRYDPADPDALLDIFRPKAASGARPAIVWVHGGGFVSGNRHIVAEYLKILAGQGFVTITVDYTIAPDARYPTPIRQTNKALGYVAANAARYGIDPDRILIGGDSAGAQIAAQVAAIATNPAYAKAVGIAPSVGPDRIKGAILFCGAHDVTMLNLDGSLGPFLRAVVWAYGGKRDAMDDPQFRLMALPDHVTADFPPAFITAGNGDPLLGQSERLANSLKSAGAPVETLFFAKDHVPALGHEYQFDLDSTAGKQALDRTVAFARRVTEKKAGTLP